MPHTPEAALSIIKKVEAGELEALPAGGTVPQRVYVGTAPFVIDEGNGDGIVLYVFMDCNMWSYIVEVTEPDGTSIACIDSPSLTTDSLLRYIPAEDVSWAHYQIPGYLRYKCPKCSSLIRPKRRVLAGQWAPTESSEPALLTPDFSFFCIPCGGPNPRAKRICKQCASRAIDLTEEEQRATKLCYSCLIGNRFKINHTTSKETH